MHAYAGVLSYSIVSLHIRIPNQVHKANTSPISINCPIRSSVSCVALLITHHTHHHEFTPRASSAAPLYPPSPLQLQLPFAPYSPFPLPLPLLHLTRFDSLTLRGIFYSYDLRPRHPRPAPTTPTPTPAPMPMRIIRHAAFPDTRAIREPLVPGLTLGRCAVGVVADGGEVRGAGRREAGAAVGVSL